MQMEVVEQVEGEGHASAGERWVASVRRPAHFADLG
jgi:hypothetical protein